MGIYGQMTGAGSVMLFGTSNNYALGITNHVSINQDGNFGVGAISTGAKIYAEGAVAGEVGAYIRNTNTAGYSVLRLGSAVHPTSIGALYALGATYATSGAYVANGVSLETLGTGGLSLTAGNASANIRFYAGGLAAGNERMTVLSTGNVRVINRLETGNGTLALPSQTFTGDTNTGSYWVGADNYGIGAGGVHVASAGYSSSAGFLSIGSTGRAYGGYGKLNLVGT